MSNQDDARLRELRLLVEIERKGMMEFWPHSRQAASPAERQVERSTVVSLLAAGLLNGLEDLSFNRAEGRTLHPEQKYATQLGHELATILENQPIHVRLSHRGRIRIAELEDSLRRGRDRDPSGILISKRYFYRDLQIELLRAARDSPLAMLVLDINNLKKICDGHGRASGDEAIQTFMQTTAWVVGDCGQGYRGDAGGKVYVILGEHSESMAAELARRVLRTLFDERSSGVEHITACAGAADASEPDAIAADLVKRAEAALDCAKRFSKDSDDRVRPSSLAVGNEEAELI